LFFKPSSPIIFSNLHFFFSLSSSHPVSGAHALAQKKLLECADPDIVQPLVGMGFAKEQAQKAVLLNPGAAANAVIDWYVEEGGRGLEVGGGGRGTRTKLIFAG
jgi:hypothetical protein